MVQLILKTLVFALPFDASANLATDRNSYREDSWNFELRSRMLKTTSNFTDDGLQFTGLGRSRFYDALQTSAKSRWVIGESWAFFAEGAFSYVETQNETTFQSRTGLMPFSVGVDFPIWRTRAAFFQTELSATIPLGEINYDNPKENQPLLSDETSVVSAHLHADFPFKTSYISAALGFQFRDKGFSSLLPYHLGYEARFSSWLAGAEIQGQQTLVVDRKVARFRHQVNEEASGGSLIYNAVDPNLIEVLAWGGYKLGPKSRLKFGVGQTLSGTNAARSTQVFASFAFGMYETRQKKGPRNLKEYRKRLRKKKREQSERQKKFRTLKESTYERSFEESESERRKRLKKISEELDEIEKDAED